MKNKLRNIVGDEKLGLFMDRCLVLNMIIEQTFENDAVVLSNEEISKEWSKVQASLMKIHELITN